MRKKTRDPRGEDGQALVELALVVPLLLFIIFAIIDFGLAINQYNNTTNLANLGARATSVLSNSSTNPSCTYKGTTYTTLVGYLDCQGAVQGTLNQVNVTVCDPTSATNFTTGDTLQVKVVSSFNWLSILTGGIGKIGGLTSLPTSISSTASMREEGTLTNATSSSWLSTSSQAAPNTTSTVGGPAVSTTGC